ncbi:MAG: PAS domain-containing protein [Actinomycetota bacterium]|nr:PAS domain-containing protein [Actinomycetota bacterium]MDH5223764.1 PAS domain-containing protein [Actinomycetota bacterium]
MDVPAARDEAALADVASSAERLLRERGAAASWLQEVLTHLGTGVHADRAYLFQNVRDPQGRLWMDLRAEWTSPGIRQIFDDPDNHLHPYAPAFTRHIDLYWRGDVLAELVRNLPEEERAVLEAEHVRSVLSVPVFVRDEWWGYVGLDECRHERIWTDEEVDLVRSIAGDLGAFFGRELAERTAALEDDRYRSMVEHGPAVSYIDATDENASSIYISPQIEALLGYAPQEWVDDPELWPRLLHPDDRARALAENERHNETGDLFRMEYRMIHRDGRVVWVHDEATMVRDERGVPRFSHGVMMDISERKRSEENAAFLSYHDELTGLPSRSMFDELLELSISRARRHDAAVAVIAVDVDDFRLINDSLGHGGGDEILKVVADRLREASRGRTWSRAAVATSSSS